MGSGKDRQEPSESGDSLSRPAAASLAGILLLSIALCFFGLARTTLWNDEGLSYFSSVYGIPETWRAVAGDTQPPFYYLTLSLWLRLGHGVFALRSLSAVAMIAALVPLLDAARRLFGIRVALLAALLFAIDPNNVGWAQKARPYAYQTLWIAVAYWGFVRVAFAPEARQRYIGSGLAALARTGKPARAATDAGWIAYSLGGAFGMLTQHPAGFFVLGCNCAMAVIILRDRRAQRVLLVNWVVAQLVLMAILLTWLPQFLGQIGHHLTAAQIARMHPNFLIDGHQLAAILRGLFSIPTLYRGQFLAVILYAFLAGFSIWRLAMTQPESLLAFAPIFVPLAVCLMGYRIVHPVFGYVIYTFDWMLVPYAILIACGLAAMEPPRWRIAVLGMVLLLNVWGLANDYSISTVPLDRVAAVIDAGLEPGDAVILSRTQATRWGLAYYLGPDAARLMGLGVSAAGIDDAALIRTPEEALASPRVWVVLPEAENSAVDLGLLQERMALSFTQRVGPVAIYRFDRHR